MVWQRRTVNSIGGNFNGDSVTDGLDFILWNAFKFTSSSDVSGRARASNRVDAAGWLSAARTDRPSLISQTLIENFEGAHPVGSAPFFCARRPRQLRLWVM